MVVRGDRLTHNNDAESPAASLLDTKILMNSVIFDANKGARVLSLDLKDFFLIPDDTMQLNNLNEKNSQQLHLHKNQAWYVWPQTGGSSSIRATKI